MPKAINREKLVAFVLSIIATIYGVSAFDVNAAELVDVLKANNNGEICDDENGYSYSFSNISIGVYREALPDEIEEMIEEAKSDGSPMSDDDIQYEMKRANHWAMLLPDRRQRCTASVSTVTAWQSAHSTMTKIRA